MTAITIGTDCILWTGAVQSSGYGSVTNGRGGSKLAHRKAWEDVHGPIPGDLTVDHLCGNKLCQNVEHMELVTRGENSRRARASKTHCKHGHPLSGNNLRIRRRADGYTYRVCKTCAIQHTRTYRSKDDIPTTKKVPSSRCNG